MSTATRRGGAKGVRVLVAVMGVAALAWTWGPATGGAAAGPAKPPSEADCAALATKTLLAFNTAVQAEDFAEYHKSLAAAYRKEKSPEQLKALYAGRQFNIQGVKDIAPAFDPAPAISKDGRLVLAGRYATEPAYVAFTLQFVQEEGQWRLTDFDLDIRPDLARYAPVATKTLVAFGAAVAAADFTDFHKTLGAPLKKQQTPDSLKAAFKSFIDGKIDLAGVGDAQPFFDKDPAIRDGVLTLDGHCPMMPGHVFFHLGYVKEEGVWRLVDINVQVRAPGFAKEQTALIRETLLAFDAAVKAKDFTAFHGLCCAALRKEKSADDLKTIFKAFIDNAVDISAVKTIEPLSAEAPKVDDQTARFVGRFPHRPTSVLFDLTYVKEGDAWRVQGINVNTKRPE